MELTLDYEGLEFGVDATYSPGRPAKVSGPPESCYPAEDAIIDYELLSYPSLEAIILSVYPELAGAELRAEVEKLNDLICDKIEAWAYDEHQGRMEAKADARFEEMKERR